MIFSTSSVEVIHQYVQPDTQTSQGISDRRIQITTVEVFTYQTVI